MNDVMLNLGIFQIKWYSFFIFLAMLTACLIIFKESKKKNVPDNYLTNLIFYGLIIGILGARLYYIIFNLDYYLNNPSQIFAIWNGGLAIHGGLISALIFLIIYSRKNKINILQTLDIIVVGVIIAQAIGRWGNFFNQEAYGNIISLQALKNMHLPKFIIDGMYISGSYREPTFLYESICSLIGFILLLILRATKKLKTGQLTAIYLIWYGIVRFGIETLRSDSLMLGQIKVAQLVSLLFVISGIALFIYSYIKKKKYCLDKIVTN